MAVPHYIAEKIGDKYVLVRQQDSKSDLLIGGVIVAGLSLLQRGLMRSLLLSMSGTMLVIALACRCSASSGKASSRSVRRFRRGPSYQHENEGLQLRQKPLDEIDEASMESFPASDAPARITPASD